MAAPGIPGDQDRHVISPVTVTDLDREGQRRHLLSCHGSILQVENYNQATSELAQTTLRSVVGQHELDEMLAEREKLNNDLRRILDEQTDAWGIKVANVELKHVDLNDMMVRAIAKQAEAERLRRAKVIDAEGELQASEKVLQAGQMLAKQPEAMQLRYLGTLLNIAGEKSSTIIFPLPMELMALRPTPASKPPI